jgi:hypothetical protein
MADEQQRDYVWHFKLTTSTGEGAEDPLEHMVEEQVTALLRCIVFTQDGEPVRVTGFRFLDSLEIDHTLPSILPDRGIE